MPRKHAQVCELCGLGKIVRTTQRLSFHEWTSKGYVLCHATIPVLICDKCGQRSWDETAEAKIEDAVKRELDKR